MQSRRALDGDNVIVFDQFWRQQFSAGGGLLTQVFSQRLGALMAYSGFRAGVSPNLLTGLAMATSLVGSLLFAFLAPGWAGTLLCALLYQLAYGFDCSDGQLARATQRSSEFGGWLDVMADLVSLLVMAFSILYWLAIKIDHPGWITFIGPLALATGRVLVLYSSKFTEKNTRASRGPSHGVSLSKKLLWLILDTPTLLLIVCLLRDFPMALNLYLVLIGGAYCLNAAYLGFTRLPRNRGEDY